MFKPLRILIVEDDPVQSAQIESRLHERILQIIDVPIELVVARTLTAALAQAHLANVTLLDLGLPDSPNPEHTASTIRRFRPPVLVMTGYDDKKLIAHCYEEGARHVFVKGEAASGLCQYVIDCLLTELKGMLETQGAA